MGTKKSSASDKNQHLRYKTNQTWAKNRRSKLEKVLKEQPNNLQVQQALKNISYRRRTPQSSHWTSSKIQDVKLLKPRDNHKETKKSLIH